MFYPAEQVTDMSDRDYVAELVREQLLRIMQKEIPHSIATRVTEWEWPRIRIEILVERESQKGIVIGHKRRKPKTSRNRSQKATCGWSLHRTSSQC